MAFCSSEELRRFVTELVSCATEDCRLPWICFSCWTMSPKLSASWPTSSLPKVGMAWERFPVRTISAVTRVSARMGRTTVVSVTARPSAIPARQTTSAQPSMEERSFPTSRAISIRPLPGPSERSCANSTLSPMWLVSGVWSRIRAYRA